MYIGVSESKVPYFFATKILHLIRCLFLQLLLTSFTIFSREKIVNEVSNNCRKRHLIM